MNLIKRIQRKLTFEIRLRREIAQESLMIRSVSKQFSSLPKCANPFFMVGIPGSLHIMMLAAKYIPVDINLFLVLNCMEDWEKEKAKDLLRPQGIITLKGNRVITHGKVLDMLFDNFPNPFGILDYDCFVFNPACFRAMQSLGDHSLLNAIFHQESPMLGKTPQTFFLFFNSYLIQTVRLKFKVNCGITDFSKHLTQKAVKQLACIGIDDQHYPEKGKQYFDTLRLITALGLSEGYSCCYLDQFLTGPRMGEDAFHVGGVADPNTTYGWWGVRGSYFWWRSLEKCKDAVLQKRYLEKYGSRKSNEIFEKFPSYRENTSKEFFDFVERIIS